MTKDLLSKRYFLLLLGMAVFLNALGLFNDIMEPDGALYASLAKQIVKSGNWMDLRILGNDWLDKPHLPFWLAAASFKVFGINAFAYKLSSFLFFIISIIYCYKLSAAIYTSQVARLATLVYATALHITISNFDGKVEIYLVAFITGAIYHTYKAIEEKWLRHIVAAALFCACAIMTKGIFTLITIAGGFIIFWLKTKQWDQFARPKWYFLILLTLIFTLPELYSLYSQFDLHPEKIVFDKTNVSGLRFFFWDSQFGRFFNSGPITGSGDPSFFVHTTLWAFLPWSIIFLLALINMFTRKSLAPANKNRWIIGGSAFITFLLFSLSRFQLPHYIIIVFPQFAMITAGYLVEKASEKTLKKIIVFQTALFFLLIALIAWLIALYSFDNKSWVLIVLSIIVIITIFYKPGIALSAVIKTNISFALMLSIFLNCLLYPSLFYYQAGMMAAKWLNSNNITQKAMLYKNAPFSFGFYYNGTAVAGEDALPVSGNIPVGDSLLVFTALSNFRNVSGDSFSINILKTFPHFKVSQLNGRFINHQTRSSELDTFAIALFKRKK